MDLQLMYYAYRTGNISAEEYIKELEEIVIDGNPHEQIAILEQENDRLSEEVNNLEFEIRGYVHDLEGLEYNIIELKEELNEARQELRCAENKLQFLSGSV